MFDHKLTDKEAEDIRRKKEQGKDGEDTNQEDVPKDILDNFPDFIRRPCACPRCGKNTAREQVTDANGPLRFRCLSCGGVSLMSDWK